MPALLLAVFFTLSLIFGGQAKAGEDLYPLPVDKQAQFQNLMHQFRCLVCQNQDLADSNADLANDLKGIIYQHVLAGESDQQIKSFLTDRYGDFVLYQPELKPSTYLLWATPVILLFIAAAGFVVFLSRRKIPA
jgi:cytochrome c-type biogenesis protein CcmH